MLRMRLIRQLLIYRHQVREGDLKTLKKQLLKYLSQIKIISGLEVTDKIS